MEFFTKFGLDIEEYLEGVGFSEYTEKFKSIGVFTTTDIINRERHSSIYDIIKDIIEEDRRAEFMEKFRQFKADEARKEMWLYDSKYILWFIIIMIIVIGALLEK